MKEKFLYLFIFCAFLSQYTIAQNYEPDKKPTKDQKDWSFAVAPYVLFAAMSTDVGGEPIRQSFNDLTSITNSGFQIIAGVRYKKIDFTFDGTFANLGFDESNDALYIKLEIIQNILDFRLGYVVYENFKFDETEVIRGWSLQLNSGAKYWKNDLLLNYKLNLGDDLTFEDEFNLPNDWWDLMLGFRLNFVLNKKVLLGVSGSGGGFGIGKSNNISYDFTYTNSFYIKEYLWINAGFRNFKYNRTDGTGDAEVKTTVNVIGPLLGLTFKL